MLLDREVVTLRCADLGFCPSVTSGREFKNSGMLRFRDLDDEVRKHYACRTA